MFNIQEAKRNGQTVLKLAGELTIYSASEAKTGLAKYSDKKSPQELDLSGIEEIDTAGVQVLLWAKREAAGRKRPITLVNHSAAVIDALDLLKVTSLFGDPILIVPSGK
jgi:anti-anti-sigma factor